MKPDLPSELSPVGLETIEAARSAAHRRGMSVHQWLQDAILRSALRHGVDSGMRPQADARQHSPVKGERWSPLQKIPGGPRDCGSAGGLLGSTLPPASTTMLEQKVLSLAAHSGGERRVGAPALAPLRDELTETRDALHGATQALQLLSQRIERAGDQATHRENLRHLEEAVAAMCGTMSRVASSDAVAMLSQDVRSLARTIEEAVHRTGGEIVRTLEARLIRIADALAQRHRVGPDCSAELGSLIKALMDKIERGTVARDTPPSSRLEELIADLAEKLDVTDARLGQLKRTEDRIEQLFLESQRNEAFAGIPGPNPKSEIVVPPYVHDLPRTGKQTNDILEALRNMLGEVLDRLAAIDARLPAKTVDADVSGIAWSAPAEPSDAPISSSQTRSENTAQGPTGDPPPSPTHMRPGAGSPTIDPSSHSGQAVEHASFAAVRPSRGSGTDRVPEVRVGETEPSDRDDHGGKSDFIAAARRAVHAARQQVIENSRACASAGIISAPAKPQGGIGKLTALIGILTGVLAVLGGSPIARTLRGSGDETKVSTLDQIAGRAGAASPFAVAANDHQAVR
jgi:hypothetical protein